MRMPPRSAAISYRSQVFLEPMSMAFGGDMRMIRMPNSRSMSAAAAESVIMTSVLLTGIVHWMSASMVSRKV